MERPSCSTYTPEAIPGNSSSSSPSHFSQTRANLTSSYISVSKMSQSSTDQESSTFDCDIIVISSLPQKMEDDCGDALPGTRGDNEGALGNSVTSLSDAWSQYRMFDGNGTYSNRLSSFNNPSVAMGTVETQQTPPLWSGFDQTANAPLLAHPPPSNQNHHSQPSTSQSQDSGPGQLPSQQLCLPYVCMFCSRRYAHQCQLRIHERVHTGEKPYQCIQCGKSFGQFCSLKRHQMVHTGERPFPCPHCGKQFSTSTNLKVHQSVHTGEKKFHCSKCGKNFSFLSNLIRHQALHTAK
ncbi:hypothetical protein LDENG_00093510 [Lucifuga dentata]|nr:hypothetical protein LDENG_00093510 [Lucifuga dentata]